MSSFPFVINIVNTAFGVTVLAVPYCFHQCGLILGGFLLFASSYASKKSCSLLLRSAQISRKRDFESLGFHVGGFLGKFIVEMSLIGYLVGTAIAWFVIIGDVSPAVVSSLLGIEKTWGLRLILIVTIGVCIVLPLSLVKDITSLSSASNVAIGIYTFFVLQLFFSTLPRILSGDWINGVNFWRPDGVLQCLPIFGISFLCQTVIFVLYEALPEPSVKKMEHVVNTAMDIVLVLSFTVGFSGYVRYFEDGVEGDLLNNYNHDFISEFIRLGFCISTILSFPLLVFPCRSSINSLISSARVDVTHAGGTFIPHDRFLIITCFLIISTLICGVIFPSVEFVMALVGATMGAMLTFILPSYIFLNVSGEDTSKAVAKVLFVTGICLFCLSTFSVLSISESQTKVVEMAPVLRPDVLPVANPPTFKPNTTFVKPSQEIKTLLPQKMVETSKRKVQEEEAIGDKGNTIDEQNIIIPKRNTAEVVKESRKEPALPQEGFVKHLPAFDQKLVEGQKPVGGQKLVEGQKPVGGQKLVEGQKPADGQKLAEEHETVLRNAEKVLLKQPDLNSKEENQREEKDLKPDALQKHSDAGLKNQNVGFSEGERTKRVPESRENSLKKGESQKENRALNDEVRIAGERKILNNGEDVEKTKVVQSRTNVNVNQDTPVEKDIIQNIVRNKTIADGNLPTVHRDTKASSKSINDEKTNSSKARNESFKFLHNIQPSRFLDITGNSEARNESINSFPKIQPSLIGKLVEKSRIKRIRLSRRKRSSHDREI